MKIFIDLLPEEGKKELLRKKRLHQIAGFEVIFFVPLLVFIVILADIYGILTFQRGWDRDSSLGTDKANYSELQSYENSFKDANARIGDIATIQNNQFGWFDVIKNMENDIPENVTVSSFSNNNLSVTLEGKAENRDILLKLRDNVSSDACFENIILPLTSMVEKEDVKFQVSFDVRMDCLKNK